MSLVSAILFLTASGQVREFVDPLTDATSVFYTVRDGERYATIGCGDTKDRKSFRVKIDFGSYLGDATAGLIAGGRPVEYRFDTKSPSQLLWHSHDTYVFATPPEARPVLFATEMRQTHRLTVRTYTFAGEPRTLVLDYPDPTMQLDEVLGRCGFNPDGSKRRPTP